MNNLNLKERKQAYYTATIFPNITCPTYTPELSFNRKKKVSHNYFHRLARVSNAAQDDYERGPTQNRKFT